MFRASPARARRDETLEYDSPPWRRRARPRCAPDCAEGLGKAGDFRRHGGREKQRLPREGHKLADALDVRDKAHVEHAVGFVDDRISMPVSSSLPRSAKSSSRPGVAIRTSAPRMILVS